MIIKYIPLLVLFGTALHADVYYAKAEPLHRNEIKANVSGRVVYVNDQQEGMLANDESIIKIDDALALRSKRQLKEQLQALAVKVAQYKEVALRRKKHYDDVNKIKSKSRTQKDTAFYAHVTATQNLAAAKIEARQIEDKLQATLKEIDDKNIIYDGLYVYDIKVTEGDYVTLGTPLLSVADTSKIRLKVFLSALDARDLTNKELYIDDVKSDAKFSQVWKMSDSEHISSYEAHLILDTKSQLSQLIKLELK